MRNKRMICITFVICISFALFSCSKPTEDAFKVGVPSISGTFNPIYTSTVYDSYVNDLVYESLLSFDKEGKRCAALASLPEISADHKTYTFTLSDNAYFSNGNKLTAEDVVFSFSLLADPVYDGMYGDIVANMQGYEEYQKDEKEVFTGIEAINENTVCFHFKEGYRTNIDSIASLKIMNKAAYPDYHKGDLESIKKSLAKPIGSGPYMVKKYASDSGVYLQKNPYYQKEGYAIDAILIQEIDTASTTLELEKGNIDAVFETSDSSIISFADKNEHFNLHEYDSANLSWLTFNCANKATSDRMVRKALTLAFDRDYFIQHYYECDSGDKNITLAYKPKIFQNPLSSLHEYVIGNQSVANIEDDSFHLEAAKQLLTDQGWILQEDGYRYKDGERLIIKVMAANEQQIADTLVTMWQKDWSAIGVEVKVAYVDFNTMIEKAMNDDELEDWNAFILSSVFSGNDLDSIYTIFHSSAAGNGGNNFARLRNSAVDKALDEGRKEFTESRVDEIYLQAAALIHNEFANIPIASTQKFDIVNQRVVHLDSNAYYPWTKALQDAELK